MARSVPTSAEIQRHQQVLEDTPRRLSEMARGRTDQALAIPPGPKAWSPVEILAHLRACSDLWTHSIYAMLAERSPALALLDERRWARTARYADAGFRRSLMAFTLERESLSVVLAGLGENDWGRDGTIGGRRHTVFSQCRRMALHEAEHLGQIEKLISQG
jgi:hypothetical protein